MKIIKPSYEILTPINREKILKRIEYVSRVCYKSENKITENSAAKFVASIVTSGHHAMIEFFDITVKLICTRGVTHQLVRHRLASYAQESTHYCNYTKDRFNNEITVIDPIYWENKPELQEIHLNAMCFAESFYKDLIKKGAKAKDARCVLPIGIKTEIVIKANLREWLHIFNLRTSKHAHTEIKYLMTKIYEEFNKELPEIYTNGLK